MRPADKIIILLLALLIIGAGYFQYLTDQLNKRMDSIIAEDQRLTDKVEDEFTDSLRVYNLRFIGRGKHLRKAQWDIIENTELILKNTDSLASMIDDVDFKLGNLARETERNFKNVRNDIEDLSDDVRNNIRRTKLQLADLDQTIGVLDKRLKDMEILPTIQKEKAKMEEEEEGEEQEEERFLRLQCREEKGGHQ